MSGALLLAADAPRGIDEPAVVVAFWVLAVMTVTSVLGVALVRDLIHAVLFLILSFVGFAGLYVTLSADFVAVVQVLIYAGAISVLMLFAILLTPRSARDNRPVAYWPSVLSVAIAMAVVIVYAAAKTTWSRDGSAAIANTATQIGNALLDPFVLPFEVASVLLVVAMVGAIALVRPDESDEARE